MMGERMEVRVDLELEIVGRVVEVKEGEVIPPCEPQLLKRLRDSHHRVAQMIAQGLRYETVALHTGYTSQRISCLMYDPSFKNLVEAYKAESALERADDMEACALVARDYRQKLHELVLDEVPMTADFALEAFKAMNDRGGNAPVSRSLSRNLNVNVGLADRMAQKLREVEHE